MKRLSMGNDLPPFAFTGLDRLELVRDDQQAMQARFSAPNGRYIPLWRGQILVNHRRDALATPVTMVTLDQAPPGVTTVPILLGDVAGVPYFCVDISCLAPSDDDAKTGPILAQDAQFVSPRAVAATLPPFDLGMTALAIHFAEWDKLSQFCSRCGNALAARQGGVSKVCPADPCGEMYFPRINPAVIMLVRDARDEKIILATAEHLPQGMASVLAGYLSPGETLIQAVKRETMEEVGIEVDDVTYYGSQPWAYSGSLMVGFSAVAKTTAINVNLAELSHADWYSRDDIRRLVASGDLKLPSPASIARMLVDAWIGD